MSKLPTAEEFEQNLQFNGLNIHDIMIEFAKLHVKAALEAVTNINEPNMYNSSILNSYPDENIK